MFLKMVRLCRDLPSPTETDALLLLLRTLKYVYLLSFDHFGFIYDYAFLPPLAHIQGGNLVCKTC